MKRTKKTGKTAWFGVVCWVLFALITPSEAHQVDWDKPFTKPLNLIHITETNTMYGPEKKDVYMLDPGTPKDGVFPTPDGSGGWFINKAYIKGGPFNTPRAVCNAVKGIDPNKLFLLPFNCDQMAPAVEKPPAQEGVAPAEKPEEPQQAVVSPTPLKPTDEEEKCPTLKEEIKRLQELRDAIVSLEKEHQLLHYQISLQRIAVLKLRAKINKVTAAIERHSSTAMSHYGDVEWAKDSKWLLDYRSRLGEQISEFYQEQDNGIYYIQRAYDKMFDEVKAELRAVQCQSVKRALKQLKDMLLEKRNVGCTELFLVSGQREKFQKVAKWFLEHDYYTGQIKRLQMLDHLEHGEMADALHTGRQALEAYPESKMLKDQIKDIELAYLEAIHAKVQGEARILRELAASRFDEFGEPGWWGYIKGVADLGIVESTRAIYGDFDLLQQLESVQGKEAAVQHLGLMLMVRLRKSGLSWYQIRGLNNEAFMQEVNTRFKLKEEFKVGPKQAMKMRFSLTQAFQNPDVQKLFKPGRQDFAVDTGEQYFDTWEFEKTWVELLFDAIDVKNVAMLTPGAVVSVGGKIAWFSEGTVISGLSKEALASGITFQDLFWTFKPIAKLTEWAGNTKTGSQCADALLKFNAEASLPKKILLEALVQDGIVRVGAAVGGVPGHVAAEVLTTLLGVGDLDQAVRVLQRSGVAKEQVGQLLKQLTKDLDRAASIRIPPSHRKVIEDAAAEYAEKGVLSQKTRKLLKQKSDELTAELNRLAKRTEKVDPRSLEGMKVKQSQLIQKSLEEGSEGRWDVARLMKEDADKLDDAYQKGSQEAKKRVSQLEEVGNKLDDGADGSGSSRPLPRANADAPGVQSSDETRKALAEESHKRAEDAAQMLETPALGPNDPKELRELVDAGDKAFNEGDISKAKDCYDTAMIKAREMKEAATDSDAIDAAHNVIKERYRLAEHTDYQSGRILPSGSALDSPVMKGIGAQEQDQVVKAVEDTFRRVEQATEKKFKEAAQEIKEAATAKALKEGRPFEDVIEEVREAKRNEIYTSHLNNEMPVLKTSGGGLSAFEPRLITVEGQTYIYKASIVSDFVDIRGESAAYQLALELKRNTPACAKVCVLRGEVGTQGLIMRFVEDAHDLSVADPGTLIAVRQRVAEDRVISMFKGDPDRHSANYLMGDNGRQFYSVDHGLSELVDSGVDYSLKEGAIEFKNQIKERVKEKYTDYLKKWGTRDPRIKLIDMHLDYDKHMKQMVERIQKLDDKAIERIVDAAYDRRADAWQKAKRTLMNRKEVLGDAIQEAIKEFKTGKVRSSHIHIKTIHGRFDEQERWLLVA